MLRTAEWCDSGHPIPQCEGCGRALADRFGASSSYGTLCIECFSDVRKRRGRMCNRCIRTVRARYGDTVSVLNRHPMKHSQVIGNCVDRGLHGFLEGFNKNVAPTFSSCQGDEALPGTEIKLSGKWTPYGAPFVMCLGEYRDAVTQWVSDFGDQYGVTKFTWYRGAPERVAVTFKELPTWQDGP